MTDISARTVLLKDTEGAYIIPFVQNATTTQKGLSKPDGSTITVDSNGTISANLTDINNELESLDNRVEALEDEAMGGASWTLTNHRQIYSGTSIGNLTIDLSEILPTGSKFELLLSIYADTSDVSNVYPLTFPVNLRNIDIATNIRTFNIYGESGRTNIVYQFMSNAINYIQTQGGVVLPTSSKTLYGSLSGTDDLQFKEFKVFLDGYKKLG